MKCAICIKKIRFWEAREPLPFSGEVHCNCLKRFNEKGILARIREMADEAEEKGSLWIGPTKRERS